MTVAAVAHVCYYPEDDEGWRHVECDCGWKVGPLPDFETAADVAGDHRVGMALASSLDLLRELWSYEGDDVADGIRAVEKYCRTLERRMNEAEKS